VLKLGACSVYLKYPTSISLQLHYLDIAPYGKNISQLFLSETVEECVGEFDCALGGSTQNIWF
jgi:hypothetical protein